MIAQTLGLGVAGWLEEGRELAAEAEQRRDAGDLEGAIALTRWSIDVFDEGTREAQKQALVIAVLAVVLAFAVMVSL